MKLSLILALVIMLLIAGLDWCLTTTESREARISLLEKQMKEKTRPVINIERATVYNTDGEIVIEGQ